MALAGTAVLRMIKGSIVPVDGWLSSVVGRGPAVVDVFALTTVEIFLFEVEEERHLLLISYSYQANGANVRILHALLSRRYRRLRCSIDHRSCLDIYLHGHWCSNFSKLARPERKIKVVPMSCS